jgi:hypothetical protein
MSAILRFANTDWIIKHSPEKRIGPGRNYWNGKNVRVDSKGRLHLKISYENSSWYCAEIFTVRKFHFGTYQFEVTIPKNALTPNTVLGMFNYPTQEVGPDGTNEIDIEISRKSKSSPLHGSYAVHPPFNMTAKYWEYPFTFPKSYREQSTHRFTWEKKGIRFESLQGNASMHKFSALYFNPSRHRVHIPQKPVRVHINLWMKEGLLPQYNRETEIIVSSFKYF